MESEKFEAIKTNLKKNELIGNMKFSIVNYQNTIDSILKDLLDWTIDECPENVREIIPITMRILRNNIRIHCTCTTRNRMLPQRMVLLPQARALWQAALRFFQTSCF